MVGDELHPAAITEGTDIFLCSRYTGEHLMASLECRRTRPRAMRSASRLSLRVPEGAGILSGRQPLGKEAKSGGCALDVGGLPAHHPRRPAYQDPTRCRT